MRRSIGLKIGIVVVPLLLVSFIALQFFIIGEFRNSSQIQGKDNLDSLSHTIFQTVRTAMNLGDREILENAIKDAAKMKGIKDLKLYRSIALIKEYNLNVEPTKEEAVVSIFRNPKPQKVSMMLDDEKVIA